VLLLRRKIPRFVVASPGSTVGERIVAFVGGDPKGACNGSTRRLPDCLLKLKYENCVGSRGLVDVFFKGFDVWAYR